jgi:hypothetical protein
MRRSFALALALVLVGSGCGGTGLPSGSGHHGREPAAADVPAVWSWAVPASGPWRLPATANVAVVVDAGRALVDLGGDGLVAVDLGTGEVGAPVEVLAAGERIAAFARVGDRVLAFGAGGDAARAWQIELDPIRATPLALPAPAGVPSPDPFVHTVAVSPDHTRLAVCGSLRPPIVRDAATLAVIATVTDADVECDEPHFVDRDHVVFDSGAGLSYAIDLRTGAGDWLDPTLPVVFPGPGGRRVRLDGTTATSLDARGATVCAFAAGEVPRLRWTPSGAVVLEGADGLHVCAADPDAEPVVLAGPLWQPRVDIADGVAVMVDRFGVAVADLEQRVIRGPAGTVSPIWAVAPRAGAVAVAADRLRLVRDGAPAAIGPAGVRQLAVAPPGRPIAAITDDVVTWDPATAVVDVVARDHLAASVLDRAGDELTWNVAGSLYRARAGGGVEPWIGLPDGADPVALDAATGRVAWREGDVYRIADVDARDVWTLQVAGDRGCGATGRVRFERGTTRFAIQTGTWIERFDLVDRARLGAVRLDGAHAAAWDLVAGTGELAIAAAGEVVLWRPGAAAATRWVPPIARGPDELAVDASGAELAIGYEDGGVAWIHLAGLRAHGSPRAVVTRGPDDRCAPPPQPGLAELLREPDPDPTSGILD